MKFKHLMVGAVAASLSLTSAFSASAADGFPITFTDAAGVEHKFDAPVKIGCVWSGCYEILADLGVKVHAASGIDASNFYHPLGLPTISVEDDGNPEHWAAAEVDVIITRAPYLTWSKQLVDVASIVHMHHPSYAETDQKGYQSYIKNLELMGMMTGKTAEAKVAIERFENMKKNLKKLATAETAKINVAVIWGGDDSEVYWSIGSVNPFCDLIKEIGIGNCAPDQAIGEVEQNAEAFLKVDPDWIVYMGGGSEQRDDPIWKRLSAVKNGQVINAANRFYCCSTRGLIHALQDYTHYILDETVPAPGKLDDFDPTQSPLVAAVN